MTETAERVYHNFEESFKEFKEATALTRTPKAQKLASQDRPCSAAHKKV
ncbi:MAG: hypothetical protein U5L96_10600 [Owenweeksia sp.]|nr:hypothetical protein [Owenweeksia sp.]